MTANQVIDARAGLSLAALDVLRNAEQVSLALKDGTTAVLGAWQTASSAPTFVLINASDKWGGHQQPAKPVPMLHVRDAQRDLWWREAIEACRRGDILVLWWWGNQLSLELSATFPWRAVSRRVAATHRSLQSRYAQSGREIFFSLQGCTCSAAHVWAIRPSSIAWWRRANAACRCPRSSARSSPAVLD